MNTREKAIKNKIEMPVKGFIAEHKELLKVLKKGNRASRNKEYAKQKKELAKYGL